MTTGIITDALTLHVPAEYATIQLALDYLEGIVTTGPVDILVADGEYAINSPITSKVRDYHRLTIRGNENDCSKCVINIDNSNNTDGFLFENGAGVSWLNGFTLRGTKGWQSKGVWLDQSYGAGIRAIGSGTVTLGTAIVIDRMYYGIRAMNGSYVVSNTSPVNGNKGGGIKCYNAGDVAFHAYNASLIVACAEAYYTAHNDEGLGFGFCAEAGGFLTCEYSLSEGNNKAGQYALTNGTVWAHGVQSSNNAYGILAWGGTVECNTLGAQKTVAFNNSIAGIYATYGGFAGANAAEVYNNQHGVLADIGGLVDVTNLSSHDNTGNGIYAKANGSISGYFSTSSNNALSGYQCEGGSTLSVSHATANNNKQHGYFAKNLGRILCDNFGGTGNLYFCSPDQSSVSTAGGNNNAFIVDTF